MSSRRDFLKYTSNGFGMLALASMLAEDATAARKDHPAGPHHPPRARHVIFCFMSGGVSQVDSFDPKPELERLHGKPMPVTVLRTQFNQNGNVMASPFTFRPRGESGIPVSTMFPHIGSVVDELAGELPADVGLLVGHPTHRDVPDGRVANAVSLLSGGAVRQTIHKTLLPSYDVFDEQDRKSTRLNSSH